MTIKQLEAREILDSRGNPTVEVRVVLTDGSVGRASVPSGASTGTHESIELRDQDQQRFGGKGVTKAVEHVNTTINRALKNNQAEDQAAIDSELVLRDATPNLAQYGANAILGVSLAVSRAVAAAKDLPYYRYLNQLYARLSGRSTKLALPTPTFNVLNGGAHTNWQTTDFQEFMLVPIKAASFAEKLRQGSEIYHALQKLLKERGLATTVGDEGGFAPQLESNEQAIELLISAIGQAGYQPGEEVMIALDPATSELYRDGQYHLKTQNKKLSTQELIAMWQDWVERYPIISLEDGLAEDDWAGWQELNRKLGQQVTIIGDDLLVTNPDRIQRATDQKACNGLLAKINQIGTLTESLQAISLARQAGWRVAVSHRSGETEDTSIADLAVAVGADYAKMGAPARSERVAKYNRLLSIEQELNQ
jgi:enolase